MQDLVAGQIDMMFDQVTIRCRRYVAGKIKAYAVTGKNRLAAAPDIPTVDEAGLPGSTFRSGMRFGRLRARRRMSSPSSMPRSWRPWPIRRYASGWPTLGQEILPRDQQTPEALARLSQGRDREVVADHQGGEYQGGISRTSGRNAMKLPRRTISCIWQRALPRCRSSADRGGANLSIAAGAHLVGNPAGSAPDIVARLMGQWSSERPPALSGNGGTRARVELPGKANLSLARVSE